MRVPLSHPTLLASLLVVVSLACQSTQPVPVDPGPVGRLHQFSSERAWGHLEALTAIGPRASGTRGASKARSYIQEQLDLYGIEFEVHPFRVDFENGEDALELKNVIGKIPGDSDGFFVLAAPYDTRYFDSFDFIGANDGGSGAALLLELARTLAIDPLPYTTLLVFLDGEAPLGRGGPDDQRVGLLGSSALANVWRAQGVVPDIRFLAYFNQVGDADLEIARDLFSHRAYREAFWNAASRLGFIEAFPAGESYESPRAGHHPFREAGIHRVTAIIDTSFGGEEPPGLYAGSEDDSLARCSPESLHAVGQVTLEALDTVSRRLVKIDRFSDTPLRELPPPEETFAPATPSEPDSAPGADPAPAAPLAEADSGGSTGEADATDADDAAVSAVDPAASAPIDGEIQPTADTPTDPSATPATAETDGATP
jgi:glutaminyl-peptide cyclotransferase